MVKDLINIILRVISWIFGIIFILFAWFFVSPTPSKSYFATIIFLIMTIAILPPTRKFVKEKLNFDLLVIFSSSIKKIFNLKFPRKRKINKAGDVRNSEEKKQNFGLRRIIFFLIFLILLLFGMTKCGMFSGETSKSGAYYKCLSKSKQCSEGIPAVQLEFSKSCKDIYMYTADAKELIDFTNGMC